jgi:hypothetical protein
MLFFELGQPADIGRPHLGILALPVAERHIAHAQFPTQLGDRIAIVQFSYNQIWASVNFLRGINPPRLGRDCSLFFHHQLVQFSGSKSYHQL